MPGTPFKICAIGCGRHATKYHGPSLKKYAAVTPNTELAACCDINPEKAETYCRAFAFKRPYTDIKTMLDAERPNAVSLVAAMNMTHALATVVLEAGYPLILEKPPGKTPQETRQLMALAAKKNVPTRVALNRRFAPLVRKLKEEMAAVCAPEEIHDIRYDISRVGDIGGTFSGGTLHAIDAVRHIAGSDYANARCTYQQIPQAEPATYNVFMECAMRSGARAHISNLAATGVSLERAVIHARGHTFLLYLPMWFAFDAPGRLVHIHDNAVVSDIPGSEVSDGPALFESCGFYYENASFFNDLRAGKTPPCDLGSALQSMEVEECLYNRGAEYCA